MSTTGGGGGVNCYKGDQLSSHYRSYATNDPFNVRYFSSSRAYNGIEVDAISSASCTGTFTGIPSTGHCCNNIDSKGDPQKQQQQQEQMHRNASSRSRAPVNSCLKPSVLVAGSVSRERNLNVVFDLPSSASSSVTADISGVNNCPTTSGSYGNISVDSTSSSTGSLANVASKGREMKKEGKRSVVEGHSSLLTSSTHNNSPAGVKMICHNSSVEMSPNESDSSTQALSSSHLSTLVSTSGSSSVTLSVLSSPLTSVRCTLDQVANSRRGHLMRTSSREASSECASSASQLEYSVDSTSDRPSVRSNEFIGKPEKVGQATFRSSTKVTGSNKGVNCHRSSSRRFRVLARQKQCSPIETDSVTDSDADAAGHRSNVSLLSSQWSLISMGDKCASRSSQSPGAVKKQQQQEQVNINAEASSSISGDACTSVCPGDHSNGTSMDIADKRTMDSPSQCVPVATHEAPLLVTSSDSSNLVTSCRIVDTETSEE